MPHTHAKWHQAEVEILKDIYSRWPLQRHEFSERLPRHTELACRRLAGQLGFTARRNVAPSFTNVTREQWIWFAGFMDGEGNFHVQRGERPSTRAAYKNLSVNVVNTHKPTIDFINDTWPGGSHQFRDKGGKWRPQWSISWQRRTVIIELVSGLLPFLITKREAAQELLAEARVWVNRYETGTATMQQMIGRRIYDSLEEIEAIEAKRTRNRPKQGSESG